MLSFQRPSSSIFFQRSKLKLNTSLAFPLLPLFSPPLPSFIFFKDTNLLEFKYSPASTLKSLEKWEKEMREIREKWETQETKYKGPEYLIYEGSRPCGITLKVVSYIAKLNTFLPHYPSLYFSSLLPYSRFYLSLSLLYIPTSISPGISNVQFLQCKGIQVKPAR